MTKQSPYKGLAPVEETKWIKRKLLRAGALSTLHLAPAFAGVTVSAGVT